MLCIFIDALNPAYLKHMPFINSRRENSLHGYLEVPLGYTGIIASFMTGMWPDKHKIFDLFIPDEKPRKKIKNKYILGFQRLLNGKRLFYTPSKLRAMDYFKSSLDKNWAQKNCLSYPTIFDFLEKNGKSFEVIDWPNHFKNRKGKIFLSKSYKPALKLARKSKADFVFVHFLDLEIAHEHGISSEEVKRTAREIDSAVKNLYDTDKNVLIFSDHGMNDIEKEIDILSEIGKLDLRFGKDFIYIIGSTTVEFWFKNEKAKEKVTKMLQDLNYGKIIDKKEFHLDTDSDLIFLANFKIGFYPNFFSNKHFKAMHGWNPKIQKTYYLLKNSFKKGKKDVKMVDFLPTILKIMNLPETKCDGESII
ncbi:alkaline phosphatase family protein [Candidatus Pacearchaeota archaeon]|nr:alkaline phosphatase family protein [Candidatus Pacearchaeota archaeon]